MSIAAVGDKTPSVLTSRTKLTTSILLLSPASEKSAAKLARALESSGASVELVRYDELTGDAGVGPASTRIDVLTRLGEFLAAELR